MIKKFLLTLIIIYGFLFIGYTIRKARPSFSFYSNPLTKVFMVFFSPIVMLNAFWSVRLRESYLLSLPLILPGIQILTLIPSVIIIRGMHLGNRERGSFISCAMFSNIGLTLGAFICLLLYGDEGLYIASWYSLLFNPFFYFVGFPLMSMITKKERFSFRETLHQFTHNPASIIPVAFMFAGLGLNLAGLTRPLILNLIATRYMSYILVAGYSFAIGLGLSLSGALKYIKHSLWLSFIKFIYNPLITLLLLFLFGFMGMSNSLPRKVVMIESFMPTAIMAVVLTKMFDLNDDLSNAAWFITTFLFIPLLPAIFYIQSLL